MKAAYCALCAHPVRRRWWHWLLGPIPVHTGSEAADCRARLDTYAASALTH